MRDITAFGSVFGIVYVGELEEPEAEQADGEQRGERPDLVEAQAQPHRCGVAFVPRTITGTGLLLWRYLGGPWEARGRFPFGGA
jgi:hypothetical protein